MAFAPVTTKSNKLRLFAAPAPNYKDFSGPPDGDYVRYVEGLMAWSQQEYERQRLKSLGDKVRVQTQSDHQWGRAPAAAPASLASNTAPMAQPGSVESKLERLRRKAAAKASKLSTQIPQPEGSRSKPQAKASVGSVIAMFAGFVLAGMFAPALLPVVIIGWVVFNVIRAVRTASSSTKS